MTKPGLRFACAILLSLACLFVSWQASAVDSRLPEEAQQVITDVEKAIPWNQANYDGLLRLRNQIEPMRDKLRARLAQMEPRRARLKEEAAKLGPKTDNETDVVAAQRTHHDEAQKKFEEQLKQIQVLSQRADQLWERLTDIRRRLFSARLLMNVSSIFDVSFWRDIVTVEIPELGDRNAEIWRQWVAHVHERETTGAAIALGAGTLVLFVLFVAAHRLLRRRRREIVDEERMPSESAVMRHALVVFAMRAFPFPVAVLLFGFLVRRLDLAPDSVDNFLLALAIGLFIVGAARGTIGALLSPHAPRWRVARCTDRTARIVSRLMVATADLYAIGIVFSAWRKLVGFRVELMVAVIMIITAAMVGRTVWSLLRLMPARDDPDSDAPTVAAPTSGFLDVRVGWTRPLVWLAVAVCGFCLVFGYVALAGFVSRRVAISAGAIALALLLVTALNRILDRSFEAGSPLNRSMSRAIGLGGRTIEIGATFTSGVARFVIIIVTGLVVFMPWGLEYGDVNPFADLAVFITATDLRGWLGTFGFAVLTFVLGLAGTRLIVGWLDGALLPRTGLDPSIRHSVRTVLGYVGLTVTTLVTLSMIGVNAQNVAVVAGALSVGIGFGLQSIVSNFVSGLIVLAERQVRVGDVVNVKSEEGVVQRISVRSTLISTYEKSSLIVPNTELITGVVRNRTLIDPTQQLRITLLLDHDSDPRKVEEIAVRIASAHPNVLPQPAPGLFFMKINELGLEFELRCVVDVNSMLRVRSDLHNSLYEAFRSSRIHFARTTPMPADPQPEPHFELSRA